MEISVYEFEQEQEMNYMYPEIYTVSADAADNTVKQITFFEVDATEYHNELGLGVNLPIKVSIWSKEINKPYSLTLFYDKSSYDENAG